MCPSAPERLPTAERRVVMCVLCGYAVRVCGVTVCGDCGVCPCPGCARF